MAPSPSQSNPARLHRVAALVCLFGSITILIYLCAAAPTEEMRYVACCGVACTSFALLNVLAMDNCSSGVDEELVKSLSQSQPHSTANGDGFAPAPESTSTGNSDKIKKRK